MSSIVHKVKDAVTNHGSSNNEHHHTGTGSANAYDSAKSSNHGPHDSNITNAADPRIDSDRSQMTGAAYNAGTTGTGANNTVGGAPQYSTHSAATGPTSSTTTGPHKSNIANEADPRIDSNLDSHGRHGTASRPYGGVSTHSATTGPASSTAGPHKSNVANEADPRVDSDLSKERGDVVGSGRFDKDVHKSSIGGGGVMHGLGGSSGPTTTKTFEQAQNNSVAGSSYNNKKTAGPHKSDMVNKMDPRVDSDLDGSKTIGSQRV
ncbi:hypothetical protein N7510_005862 [Penicillium lagena]|uniref:uncharacterized protein n=1 Tax=Penicillium lagena TaxID=94218 RepID=UPI0025425718|nr:uncharacterized protein N7510_005862 [Penicillium lagena]KAJ5612668.1 hypothetical protein N7510_005862 [Penicillium lagena]